MNLIDACLWVPDVRDGCWSMTSNQGRWLRACEAPQIRNTDDLWYDSVRKRIYVPGGEGFIFVFQQIDADHYQPIAKIPTAIGARVSFYSSETVGKHNDLYLAVPAHSNQEAEM
jgi:hypothetical protein